MNYLSVWVSLYFLYILCIEHAIIKRTNCCISTSMQSAMSTSDTSQATPVQITYVPYGSKFSSDNIFVNFGNALLIMKILAMKY